MKVKNLNPNRRYNCPGCSGVGYIETNTVCPHCEGKGELPRQFFFRALANVHWEKQKAKTSNGRE